MVYFWCGGVLLLSACSSSKKAGKTETASSTSLHDFEADFKPADHEGDASDIFANLRKERDKKETTPEVTTTPETPLFVTGYRVQLYATNDIDEANAKKATAEAAFPDEWFYIEYDPPTYKLRAGNFLSRSEAESFLQTLQSAGYPDAWIVPDRVLKSPPLRRAQKNPD